MYSVEQTIYLQVFTATDNREKYMAVMQINKH